MTEFDRVLVLETSGRVGQVALSTGNEVIAEERLAEAHRRASDLTLAVQRLLSAQSWKARDLTAVVVGLGPGSYTGLRVGLASAKAIAYATGCKFFGVETFAAIAMRLPHSNYVVSVVADALKGKLFRRDYQRTNGELTPTTPLQIVEASAWQQSLPSGTTVSGPGARIFTDRVTAVDESLQEPRPVDLLLVARACPWAVTADVWRAEPLYLRGSSAEEKVAGPA